MAFYLCLKEEKKGFRNMDYLIRGTMRENRIRFLAITNKMTTQEIVSLSKTTPVASAAISRLVSVAAMMGVMQKNGKVTLKIEGNGPIKMMMANGNSLGQVRGYVMNPNVDLPLNVQNKLDVGGAVGSLGVLSVIKDLEMKQNFSSQVELQTGEIGDDFSYYFFHSEQTPSVVSVGALVDVDFSIKQAGGFIVQILPDATEEDYEFLQTCIATCPSMTSLLEKYASLEQIMKEVFQEVEVMETIKISFHCPCNVNKFVASLATLQEEELQSMIDENKDFEVVCEFCKRIHTLTNFDLQKALNIRHQK